MGEWEHCRALLLEVRIKNIGLTSAAFRQLKNILNLQFEEDNYTEIMGSIFANRDETNPLEFEVIKSPETTELEKALRAFGQRDFSQVSILSEYLSQTLTRIEKYHGENRDLRTTQILFNAAAKKPETLQKLNDESINLYFKMYRSFLETHTCGSTEDFKVNQKGFVGIFHCHNDGSIPSPLDIQANLESGIPDLVIAATKNYTEIGATFYLVSEGQIKELYQGPLEAKKS